MSVPAYKTGGFQVVRHHRLAQHDDVGIAGQPGRNALPVFATVAAAPDRRLTVDAHAELVALFEHDVDRLRVVRMDDDRKAEAARQFVLADVDPVVAAVVAAIDAAVILLE